MAQPYSAHWKRLIGASLAVLAAAFAAPRFVRAPDIAENRVLAPPPALPRDLAGWRTLRPSLDGYIADHFPPRPHLIGALNALRLKFGVSGTDRVVVGREGWLFYDNGTHLGAARGDPPMSEAEQKRWLAHLAGRSEFLQQRGIAYLVVAAPAKEAVFPQYAPAWFRLGPERSAVRLAGLAQQTQSGEVLYLAPVMARPAHWGMKLYSRHDTHWTGLGAYEGYAAILRKLQTMGVVAEGPRPLEAFTEIVRPSAAKPHDLALMLGVASFVDLDYPEITDPAAEAAAKVTHLAGPDWTKPRIIDTGQAGKPVLLMTVDSFSNALVPFLLGHFSRIVVAHNQDSPWREDLIARFQPDIVMLEVAESGLPVVMGDGPPASPDAGQRIAAAFFHPVRTRMTDEAGVIRTTKLGGDGDDRLDGADTADDLQGRLGNDTLRGLAGADELRGGKGDDILDGGAGDDWLAGGRGDDTVTGGAGADIFNSFAAAGVDRVLDFNLAEGDRVQLDPGTVYTVRQEGADTVVAMEQGRLVLKGVQAASLPVGTITLRAR
jgi:hypothetical protein